MNCKKNLCCIFKWVLLLLCSLYTYLVFSLSSSVIFFSYSYFYQTLENATDYEAKLSSTSSGIQPRVVFVGDFSALKSYITLVNQKYWFDDPIRCIEACMHLFLALNVKYPPESIVVWNFIQKFIFGVNTKFDSNHSCLQGLQNDVQKLM